jgi:hypothetical protein
MLSYVSLSIKVCQAGGAVVKKKLDRSLTIVVAHPNIYLIFTVVDYLGSM